MKKNENRHLGRLLALGMALAMGASFFACGRGNEGDLSHSTEPSTQEVTQEPTGEAVPTQEETVSDTVAPVDASQDATTQAGPKKPETKQEILAYYAKAVEQVKNGGAKVTRTKREMTVTHADLNGSWEVTKEAGMINESKPAEGVANSEFPPSNHGVRELNPSAVSQASCELSGDTYRITIRLNPEENDPKQATSEHGKVFNPIGPMEAGQLEVMGIVLKGFHYQYQDSYLTCDVEAATGRILKADFVLKGSGAAKVPLMGTANADLQQAESYTIAW